MEKSKLFFTLSMCVMSYTLNAQVGVNTDTPNTKSFLHVSEGTGDTKEYKGTILSSYTTEERDNLFGTLDATHDGMVIYNKSDKCFNVYEHNSNTDGVVNRWKELCETRHVADAGITASYVGVPLMVGVGREMVPGISVYASGILPIKLATDDWFQLDFGNVTTLPGTVKLYINNISDQSITISGRSTSNNTEIGQDKNFVLNAGSKSPEPGVDPYAEPINQGAFGYSHTWSEVVSFTFTATAADGTVRDYYAVWTSLPSSEVGSYNGAIKTELHLYRKPS